MENIVKPAPECEELRGGHISNCCTRNGLVSQLWTAKSPKSVAIPEELRAEMLAGFDDVASAHSPIGMAMEELRALCCVTRFKKRYTRYVRGLKPCERRSPANPFWDVLSRSQSAVPGGIGHFNPSTSDRSYCRVIAGVQTSVVARMPVNQ